MTTTDDDDYDDTDDNNNDDGDDDDGNYVPSPLFELQLVIVQCKNAAADGGDAVFLKDKTVIKVLRQVAVVQVLDLVKT